MDDNPYLAPEWAAAEIRAALVLARRAADSELNFALDLRRRLPRVAAMLEAGDIDHRIPYSEGGPTTVDHLAPLCRHDHMIRHRAGWTYIRLGNSDHRWTSRLGHTYTTSGTPP